MFRTGLLQSEGTTVLVRRFMLAVILGGMTAITGQAETLQSRLQAEYQAGMIAQKDVVLSQLYAAWEPERLTADYRTLQPAPRTCGTLLLLQARDVLHLMSPDEQQWYLNKTAARPILPLSHVSPSGEFKIHYTTASNDSVDVTDLDGDTIPDWVENVALAFDSVAARFRDLGYQPLPADGGDDGPEFDVYLQKLGNYYGQTFFPPSSSVGTYMVLDPRFENSIFYTKGFDGARVTVAHELHHAVQFGYTLTGSAFGTDQSNYAFFEITSTYMEDYIYDDVNDYLQYLPYMLEKDETPFTSYNGHPTGATFFEYGNCIWGHYLERRFGSLALTQIWNRMGDLPAVLPAMDHVLGTLQSSFEDELNTYHLWNFFTGARADTVQFYQDGRLFDTQPALAQELALAQDTTETAITNNYLSPYYITFDAAQPDSILLELSAMEGNDVWRYTLVVMDGNTVVETVQGTPAGDSTTVIRYLDNTNQKALLVATTVARKFSDNVDANSRYTLNIRAVRLHADPTSDIEELTSAQPTGYALHPNYPNPFNPQTTIRFDLPQSSQVRLTVHDVLGRRIRSLTDGMLSEGVHQLRWDGRNDFGMDVAGGVYFYRLETGAFTQSRKMLLLR
jgi:hypothetical protein